MADLIETLARAMVCKEPQAEPPLDDDLPGECDWGNCDKPPIAWRRCEDGHWLPVCEEHLSHD